MVTTSLTLTRGDLSTDLALILTQALILTGGDHSTDPDRWLPRHWLWQVVTPALTLTGGVAVSLVRRLRQGQT